MRNIYACLILLIQLWATKIDIALFLSSLMSRKSSKNFVAGVAKFFMGILIFLVFSKSGIHYLWQGEISVCKVLVPIKVVPVKTDYFFIKYSNCIDISK